MYFDITLEDLLNKSQVSPPRWYTICSKVSYCNVIHDIVVSSVNVLFLLQITQCIEKASPEETCVLDIEKEAVVNALLQSLARDARPSPNKVSMLYCMIGNFRELKISLFYEFVVAHRKNSENYIDIREIPICETTCISKNKAPPPPPPNHSRETPTTVLFFTP